MNETDEAWDVNIYNFLLSSLPHLKAAKRRRREAISSPSQLLEKHDVNTSVKRAAFFKKNMAIRSRYRCRSDVSGFV
ncbi:MAG: hypothetical protein PV344_03055, partial [Anaplasma sp.]|nr:hypothetical protein [Anaplasma sp.]